MENNISIKEKIFQFYQLPTAKKIMKYLIR